MSVRKWETKSSAIVRRQKPCVNLHTRTWGLKPWYRLLSSPTHSHTATVFVFFNFFPVTEDFRVLGKTEDISGSSIIKDYCHESWPWVSQPHMLQWPNRTQKYVDRSRAVEFGVEKLLVNCSYLKYLKLLNSGRTLDRQIGSNLFS